MFPGTAEKAGNKLSTAILDDSKRERRVSQGLCAPEVDEGAETQVTLPNSGAYANKDAMSESSR